MFYIWVIVIGAISVLWAIWSLRGIGKNSKIIKGVKKELSTGRVIFQDHSSPSSDSSS